jgi:hypothetical protein
MNKILGVLFLILVVLIAGFSYWIGFREGSAQRFVPYAANVRLALDSRTGQLCSTVPPESSNSDPQCKDLK